MRSLAVGDLAAVAIRQARLRNSAWERSDHADRLLHTDRLTGLANRVTFERMLELEIARATRQGSPLAVVMLDVDGLTGISQHQGARVADEVLRHVAAAIADRVRLLDTVARFGEDEFVVIAPGDAGGIVALRLRDAIAELPPIGEVEISVSAAVVHHPADGATGSDLVAASEVALEQAKSSGPRLDLRGPVGAAPEPSARATAAPCHISAVMAAGGSSRSYDVDALDARSRYARGGLASPAVRMWQRDSGVHATIGSPSCDVGHALRLSVARLGKALAVDRDNPSWLHPHPALPGVAYVHIAASPRTRRDAAAPTGRLPSARAVRPRSRIGQPPP